MPMTLGRGIILVNPASGPDDDTASELGEVFSDHEVREVDPAEIGAVAQQARADGAAFVGVAGGDGTMRGAATALCGGQTPLLPIPGGTRNHFSRALGIATVDAAAAALEGASVTGVDIGSVNGEVFVNNASIGVYPRIVRTRRTLEHRFPKRVATMVAAWPQIRSLSRLPVRLEGAADVAAAWMVFVGNGRYGTNVFQAAEREDLTEGVLDLRICHADAPLSRLRAAGALLAGRIDRSPMVSRSIAPRFVLECTGTVDLALDGEVMRMESPLRFEARPAALPVICGGDPPTAAGQEA